LQYFFDVRSDSDALYNIYGVSLANVYDLQLLELAGRSARFEDTTYLHGLKRCITAYLNPPREWRKVKDAGCALFAPEKGGRYEVFEQRPLDPRLIAYCAQDVTLLFQLESALLKKMGLQIKSWETKVDAGSAERVKLAFNPTFVGKGSHMAIASPVW
jgi:exonuclease 3'-5' domain-containing protein 1